MILKTIGLILLALSSVLAGVMLGRREKKSAEDLKLLLALMDYLKSEISYRKTALPLCFSAFFDLYPHESAPDFVRLDYPAALAHFSLSKSQNTELLSFFSALGTSTATEECLRIAQIYEKLNKTLLSREKDLPQKKRVYITLGICVGAVILLLFL